MLYRWIVDVLLILHFAVLLFVSIGGLLLFRWPRLAWLHLPIVLWGFIVEYFGLICPLTPLENALRHRAGMPAYSGAFIEHYITVVPYPDGLTRGIRVGLAAAVIVINATIYWRVLHRASK